MSLNKAEAGPDSFGTRGELSVGGTAYEIHRLDRIEGSGRLPYSLKVMLENLLRNEDGRTVTAAQIEALRDWKPEAERNPEIQFTPARVLMQDFTGVPCVVDLVAMRDAMIELGGDPSTINPQIPAELVIDHSVIADSFASPDSFGINAQLEFERNQPVGHARRCAAGEESRRSRTADQALGQDHPRPGLTRRHRLLLALRAHAVSRGARVPSGRLRLHHVHR